MSTRFDDDTALTLASDGSFTATVSGEWTAGRGPHGGYIAAIILRGLMDTVADSARQPRSLTVHYARAGRPTGRCWPSRASSRCSSGCEEGRREGAAVVAGQLLGLR